MGVSGIVKLEGERKTRQPFANPFANLVPTFSACRQPFAKLFCQPLSKPVFLWTPCTVTLRGKFITRGNALRARGALVKVVFEAPKCPSTKALLLPARWYSRKSIYTMIAVGMVHVVDEVPIQSAKATRAPAADGEHAPLCGKVLIRLIPRALTPDENSMCDG